MALVSLGITPPSHDFGTGFCAGAFATTLAAGAFDAPFAADCAFTIGFAGCGGLATDALGGEDGGAEDGSMTAMALFRVGITPRNHDTGGGCRRGALDAGFTVGAFGSGFGIGRALTIGAAGCGTAIGCAGLASGTRMALSGARPRRMAKPASIGTAAGS